MSRSEPEKSRQLREEPDCALSLDARLASLLEAIESEQTPARLLELAEQLQRELALRKQRRSPH